MARGTRTKAHGVAAVSEQAIAELDPRMFLGRLATYTLPDEPISGAKLVRLWGKHELDLELLPEARQPVHVFQSACASVKTRRGVANGAGARTEITADEVHNNGGKCDYQITVKVWDQAARVIEYEKALRATFDKRTSEISFDDLGYADPRLAQIEREIRRHFEANAKTVPGQKVRNAVRAALLANGAQNLRRKAGGLYFVPAEWRENGEAKPTKNVLDGLKSVLREAYGEARADFYTIPLMQDDEMRQMVAKHFSLNVKERSEELVTRAVARVRQGKGERNVRSDMLANMYSDRRKLAGSIQQFEQLVDLERGEVEANLRDVDEALQKLQDLADEE